MEQERRLQQKIDELQRQWDRLSDKLTVLERQRIRETRVEEKSRLEDLIAETRTERDRVEKALSDLETQRHAATTQGTSASPAFHTDGAGYFGAGVAAAGDVVGRNKYEYHYHGDDDAAKLRQAESVYRQEVADRCCHLPLRGVDPSLADAATTSPIVSGNRKNRFIW